MLAREDNDPGDFSVRYSFITISLITYYVNELIKSYILCKDDPAKDMEMQYNTSRS